MKHFTTLAAAVVLAVVFPASSALAGFGHGHGGHHGGHFGHHGFHFGLGLGFGHHRHYYGYPYSYGYYGYPYSYGYYDPWYSSSYWYPSYSLGCHSYPTYGTYYYPSYRSYSYSYWPFPTTQLSCCGQPSYAPEQPAPQPAPPRRIEPVPEPAPAPPPAPGVESPRRSQGTMRFAVLRNLADADNRAQPMLPPTASSTANIAVIADDRSRTSELRPQLAVPKVRAILSDDEAPWIAK